MWYNKDLNNMYSLNNTLLGIMVVRRYQQRRKTNRNITFWTFYRITCNILHLNVQGLFRGKILKLPSRNLVPCVSRTEINCPRMKSSDGTLVRYKSRNTLLKRVTISFSNASVLRGRNWIYGWVHRCIDKQIYAYEHADT